jgi:hypothetical protein
MKRSWGDDLFSGIDPFQSRHPLAAWLALVLGGMGFFLAGLLSWRYGADVLGFCRKGFGI